MNSSGRSATGEATRRETSAAYPASTLVVGVGRLGLAVLEALGEDWARLARCGPDPSFGNLALLAVRGPAESASLTPREATRRAGSDDLADRALDLAVLRSLGLVRWRDGIYQVAMPRDIGPVAAPPSLHATAAEEVDRTPLARRRFFDWLPLDPDPLRAADRLTDLADEEPALHLFVTPLLQRVRQGHAPQVLLVALARSAAFAAGRDPSPWSAFRETLLTSPLAPSGTGAGKTSEPGTETPRRIEARGADAVRALVGYEVAASVARGARSPAAGPSHSQSPTATLEGYAPPPLASWSRLLAAFQRDHETHTEPELTVIVPSAFVPRVSDLASPLPPDALLHIDWESSGWATRTDAAERLEFPRTHDATPFRLGLFDHDASPRAERPRFASRLRELGAAVERGLAALAVDLGRDRVRSRGDLERGRDAGDRALAQSLEILGGVRTSVPAPRSALASSPPLRDAIDERFGPLEPSAALLGLRVPTPPRGEDSALERLDRRLSDLDLHPRTDPGEPLARAVEFHFDAETHGDHAVRSATNALVRRLFDAHHLRHALHGGDGDGGSRHRPVRLTVFVVADLGEASCRRLLEPLLASLHAEILRGFSPLLGDLRDGFDRALSIVPVLSAPHPADAHGGPSDDRLATEAAILDSLHSLRQTLEATPRRARRVPQIFISGRVTESGVLDPRETVRQTRDFLHLLCRNPVHLDAWLRKVAMAPGGDDLFASFACRELELPAEIAREYLAGRSLRDLFDRLLEPRPEAGVLREPLEVAGPDPDPLEAPMRRRLAERADAVGERLRATVERRLETAAHESGRLEPEPLGTAFDDDLLAALALQVEHERSDATLVDGAIDHEVADLRAEVALQLEAALADLRRDADAALADALPRRGIPAALAHAATTLRQAERRLAVRDRERQARESEVVAHGPPSITALDEPHRAVRDAAAALPASRALRWGLALVAGVAPALGAGLATALVPGLAERFVSSSGSSPLGPLPSLLGGASAAGTLLVVAGLAWVLRWHRRAGERRVRGAVADLATRAAALATAPIGAGRSLRSFFETRLRLAVELAVSRFAREVRGAVAFDAAAIRRLARIFEAQRHALQLHAEGLGVRPAAGAGTESGAPRDDLGRLFARRGDSAQASLVPSTALEFEARRRTSPDDLDALFHRAIAYRASGQRAGGQRASGQRGSAPSEFDGSNSSGSALDGWRREPFATDTAALLSSARGLWRDRLEQPFDSHERLADAAVDALGRFVDERGPGLGFGAKFRGSEGLDPDGLSVLADATLVVHPSLERLFRTHLARGAEDPPSGTRVPPVLAARVRPHAAYLLSLAQGLRPHTIANFRRHRSFHERPRTEPAICRLDAYPSLQTSEASSESSTEPRPVLESGPAEGASP